MGGTGGDLESAMPTGRLKTQPRVALWEAGNPGREKRGGTRELAGPPGLCYLPTSCQHPSLAIPTAFEEIEAQRKEGKQTAQGCTVNDHWTEATCVRTSQSCPLSTMGGIGTRPLVRWRWMSCDVMDMNRKASHLPSCFCPPSPPGLLFCLS